MAVRTLIDETGKADTLEEAKAGFKRHYQEVKGRKSRLHPMDAAPEITGARQGGDGCLVRLRRPGASSSLPQPRRHRAAVCGLRTL